MQLHGLTHLLRESTAFNDLMSQIRQGNQLSLNLIRSARPYLLAAIANDWEGPIIYVTGRIKSAYNISEQLPVWLPEDRSVLRFPEPTTQFYERVTWGDSVIRERMETLSALSTLDDTEREYPIVVTSARALMQRTMPARQFRRSAMSIRIGDRFPLDKLLHQWVGMGYEPVPIVVEEGTFSRRGGVVDIFPTSSPLPVRIEFFDDEVDSMRLFDVATQRSEKTIKQFAVTPTREALPEFSSLVANHLNKWFETLQPPEDDMTSPSTDYESLSHGVAFPYLEFYLPYMYANPNSLLDYATDNTLIVVEDMSELADIVQEIEEQALQARDDQQNSGQLPSDYPQPYIDWETLSETINERTTLQLTNAINDDESDESPIEDKFSAIFTPIQRFGGQLRPFLRHVRDLNVRESRVIVVTQQTARLRDLWYEQDSEYAPLTPNIEDKPADNALLFVGGALTEGWSLQLGEKSGEAHLITDAEIFGWSRPEPRRRKAGKSRPPESSYADWKEGIYVVHVDYGVGQFIGMRHRTIDGNDREYLVVQYGGNDMIFVPIHQADRLTKYIGADDSQPNLSRLGQPEWKRIRSRAKKAIEEEATELLALYAARAQAKGITYSKDTPWQHELEASFPYVETDDQLRSVREVKGDMEAGYPMDRLICGDVGYGKTEVALRAAFKAVMDGKQVAVLVPTTVLAHQHYETFSRRLEPFPVQVEVLSRFRNKEHISRIMPKIATGEVDIVIGTHRILSKDVTMKDLGLVIIDEEQRFGVKHKEHFKQLRNQIDILTLTATPIPRTLYMGLTGVRDISMIQTPPEERLPVITHVGKFDSRLVRQALMREMERGGQVFIVHNRVKTIHTLRDKIQSIVPEARITVGHGQMSSNQLEQVMTSFGRGEYDILISTSIIESGIDIPNVNTMIIDRADWFGMAQLYQLRGRVGRGAQQAYAYFFHGGSKRLTEEAKARLDTLAENTNLGAGFQIAMRDLEIRGAGDILSTRQTGHVAAIGLNLYTQLLTQSINKLKGQQDSSQQQPSVDAQGIVIDLPIPAYLPSDWIAEMALRLQIYRRIAGLNTVEQVHIMRQEIRDRFGQLPSAVEGLLYQMEVKLLAQSANATHVMGRDKQVQIKLPYLAEVNRPALAQELGEDIQVSRTAVTLPLDNEVWQLRLVDVLKQLAEGINTGVGI